MPIYFSNHVFSKLLINVSFLLFYNSAYAGLYDSLQIINLPKFVNEYKRSAAFHNSSFYYFDMMDSCSRNHNCTDAGYYLQKINPYFFLSLWNNSVRPDTLLSRYSLKKEDRDIYEAKYLQALKSKKSELYNRMKQMDEQETERTILFDTNTNKETHKKAWEDKWQNDQKDFTYLYQYVKENGWPSFENGSFYALEIAMKDYMHQLFYLSFVMDPYSKGLHEMDGLTFLYNYNFKNYYMQCIGQAAGKSSFYSCSIDLDNALDSSVLKTTNSLKKVVSETCNDKYPICYILAGPQQKDMELWLKKDEVNEQGILKHVQKELHEACQGVNITSEPNLVFMPYNRKMLIIVTDR